MAAATRASAVSAGAVAMREKARASAGQGQREQRGSAPVDADGRDLLAGHVGDGGAHGLLQGMVGLEVGRRAASRSPRRWPAWRHACPSSSSRPGWVDGRPGRRRASPGRRPDSRAVSAGPTRRGRRWRGCAVRHRCGTASPEWLAHASASSSPSRSSPARNMPTAWIGLFDERGKTGRSGSPSRQSSLPSAASATTEPRWQPSTKSLRTTSASTADCASDVCGTPRTLGPAVR